MQGKQQMFRRAGIVAIVFLFVFAIALFSWWQSPWGQIYQVKRELAHLSLRINIREWPSYSIYDVLEEVVIAFSDVGDLKRAHLVVETLPESENKARALSAIAGLAAKMGNDEKSQEFLEQAVQVAKKTAATWDDSSKTSEHGILCDIVESMAETAERTSVRNVAFLEQARLLAKGIRFNLCQDSALYAIIESAAALAVVTKDTEFLKLARQVVEDIQYFYKKKAQRVIAKSAAKIAEITKDRAAFYEQAHEIAEVEHTVTTLLEIAQSTTNLGAIEKAQEFLEEAVQVAEEIIRPEDKAAALLQIVEFAAKVGNIEIARQFLEKSHQASKEIMWSAYYQGPYDKASTLLKIAESTAKIGDNHKAREFLEQARQIAGKIEDDAGKISILGTIAWVTAKIGEKEKALEVVEQARQIAAIREVMSSDLGEAVCSFVESVAEIGETTGDTAFLEKAHQVAIEIESSPYNYFYKARAMGTVVVSAAKIGDSEKLRALLEEACRVVDQEIYYYHWDDIILHAIAKSAVEARNWRQVCKIAKSIPNDLDKAHALAAILSAWAYH